MNATNFGPSQKKTIAAAAASRSDPCSQNCILKLNLKPGKQANKLAS